MAVWPILGMVLGPTLGGDLWLLLLGGLTVIISLPVMVVTGPFSESVMVVVVVFVWCLAWLLPPWTFRHLLRSTRAVILLLLAQSLISLVQSGLGLLMWLGRDI